ncbi:AAA family ATPase [Parabacteroides acidifaciens]|uniref:AAA family ATPase n=1 Tax=Parabacteroides acidifaciens TaxID=2290935 RepID=A0A3D8HEI9_9BACT|nr:AAA family ATPase [Parabacteroides acidifaciens]MBC8601904.1 AAA family ATPase [Parabacteroides acidifaciens]RDU49358.1 hypothetical protein DWU89_09480 [Parabacteroides acidifaciens]
MINHIQIEDYKCLHDESLKIKPFTIITGVNSAGKSSLIQSVLLPVRKAGKNGQVLLDSIVNLTFDAIRNKYYNAKSVRISLDIDGVPIMYHGTNEHSMLFLSPEEDACLPIDIEQNLYYLSANRIGAELHSKISPQFKVGVVGEYILGSFEKEKSNPLIPELIKNDSSYTLSTQVNYWLSYILDTPTELQTERRLDDVVEVQYKSDGLGNISPFQLGAGVSYLTKMLIMCLRAKKNDVILIENPEIHLHPASQAKVGEFLAFIAKAGIQVIIETHCEHLIYKVGYEVYKKRFSKDNVTILYKEGIQNPFVVIDFKEDGKFTCDFPEGFFDATLAELLEME